MENKPLNRIKVPNTTLPGPRKPGRNISLPEMRYQRPCTNHTGYRDLSTKNEQFFLTTMTKYSEFIKPGNLVCYKGRKVTIDEILDYTSEEIPTDEELDDAPNLYYAGIIYDDMATDTIPVCRLKPLRQISDLTEDELISLWRQIRVGSLSYKDYANTLGIERKYLSDVCDAYMEAIESSDSYEWLKIDTPHNFAEYCMDYCCIQSYSHNF